MGKLRKLRSRFINGVGAVKRSILRLHSQGSTASNSTTLTPVDDDLPAITTAQASRARSGGPSVWKKTKEGDEEDPPKPAQQLQLHWSEARRIYSEPVHTIDRVSSSRGEATNRSSTSTTVTDCRSLSCAVPNRFPTSPRSCSAQVLASNSAGGLEVPACLLSSDEEENDDVFLESWEESQRGRGW